MNRGLVSARNARRRGLARLVLALLFVALMSAAGGALWDLRAPRFTLDQARAAAASGDEHATVAAVVTLLRESRQCVELLQELAQHPNPKIADQAKLAVDHLRRQVR